MGTDPRNDASEQNWRLQAEIDSADKPGALEQVVGSLRGPAVIKDVQASVSGDVVITHDGNQLFAYASDEATLRATRQAIEGVMAHDGIGTTSIRLSHWDSVLDDWRQIDPPPATPREQQAEQDAERDAEKLETRTLVAKVGKMIRVEFERSLDEWASELGVQCAIIEHRHLMTEQVGFTITGPKRKLDEFAEGLKAEEWATVRAETQVMISPL